MSHCMAQPHLALKHCTICGWLPNMAMKLQVIVFCRSGAPEILPLSTRMSSAQPCTSTTISIDININMNISSFPRCPPNAFQAVSEHSEPERPEQHAIVDAEGAYLVISSQGSRTKDDDPLCSCISTRTMMMMCSACAWILMLAGAPKPCLRQQDCNLACGKLDEPPFSAGPRYTMNNHERRSGIHIDVH